MSIAAHDTLFRTDPAGDFEQVCREGGKTVTELTARAGVSQPAVQRLRLVFQQIVDFFRCDEVGRAFSLQPNRGSA